MLQQILSLLIAFMIMQNAAGQKTSKNPETITISGKVVTSDLRPVAGAVIFVDNVRTSYFTKPDGTFKIKVSSATQNIKVSSSSYGSLEKPVEGHNNMSFVLTGGEMVVTSPDSAAIESFKKPHAKKMNTYNDIYQMIRAEVPGVVVSGHSISIQQGHSFFGSSTPLFVINGAIVSSIDNVNPRDVKSIKILKGGEAALYGNDGSNGVVSITLKNGTEKDR